MNEHLADNDGFLAHLLVADLRRYVGAQAASNDNRGELTSIFRLLDEAFVRGDSDLKNAIAVSFVEDINAEPFVRRIERYFGPAIKAEYSRISWRNT